MFGSSQKKKGFYLDDDDTETSMYFNSPAVSSFRSERDLLGSSSPSSQLASFGNVNSIYQQQQQQQQSLQRGFAPSSAFQRTTPTSGLGQPSLLTLQQQQQQSPSRSLLGNLAQRGPGGGGAPVGGGGGGGYHGQASQSFPALAKRGQAAPGGPMGLHSVFYPPPRNQGDLLPGHSNFDLSHSEFPSLGNRSGGASGGGGGGALTMQASMRGYAADMNGTGQAKYAQAGDQYRYGAVWPRGSSGGGKGAVGDPANEFSIQQEDFPALPGTQSSLPSSSAAAGGATESSSKSGAGGSSASGGGGAASREPSAAAAASAAAGVAGASSAIAGIASGASSKDQKSQTQQQQQQKKGIQNLPDGTVTNIPAGMVTDQFGMVGLLTFIRAAETDPQLVALAPGIDLTTLGLNLNLSENLYSTFQSPFAEMPCRPQDIDYTVPTEYLTNVTIREKLSPIKLSRYGDDLLFFLFYTNPGDVLQLLVAAELYNRDWRYHKDEQVWITRANTEPVMKNNSCERGTYIFFDVQNWRKVPKECVLEYSKLEERPMPPASHMSGQIPGLMGH